MVEDKVGVDQAAPDAEATGRVADVPTKPARPGTAAHQRRAHERAAEERRHAEEATEERSDEKPDEAGLP
jgi:hypothetical protein